MAATNVEKSREAIRTRLEEQLSHNFEPAPKSIADLKFLTLWETRSISTFEVLEEFPHIEHIHFFGQSTIADLTGIERLPRLQSIRFEPKVKIRSGFDSVFKVATLESLTLSSQFHRLVNLQPSVRKLNLSDASISTLPAIPKSARVEELHVGHRKHVLSDLKSLCHYPKLKNLCVDSSKTMNSLAGVEYCSDLAVLSANLTAIDNLGPLSNALKLTELRIRKTNVKSLSPLFQNDSLETLYAEKSKLTEIDGIAEGLPNLRLLWLFDTKIKDLSPIAGLKQLVELVVLRFNRIKDWSFLRHLSSLESLDLHDTSFSDVEILSSLRRLKYVLLSRTDVAPDDQRLVPLRKLLEERKGGISFDNVQGWASDIDKRFQR